MTDFLTRVLERRLEFETAQQGDKTIEFAIIEIVADCENIFDHHK